MQWQQGLAGEHPLPLRASDAERDQVVGELRERFAEGRLSQDSFVRRVDAALRAREQRELAGLLADMPARRGLAGALARAAARATTAARRAAAQRPALMFPAGPGHCFTIGRDGSCDLILADVTVSRRHARLERNGTDWLLQDLGSTNGTRLNGWLVSGAVPVRAGDQVSFGAVSFVLAGGR
jgi:hypothetical protein